MDTLVCDTETDGFLKDLTRIWTIQLADAEQGEVTVYADQPGYAPLSEAAERMSRAGRVVLHNGIGFDYQVIERFFPGAVVPARMFDTLVAARLRHPDERDHSLSAWGRRLGLHKGEYSGDFQSFTQELVDYAIQDVHVGRALYQKVRDVDGWGESCDLEHQVAWAINAQERNGFLLDVPRAEALAAELRGELALVTSELQRAFPPQELVVTFIPKRDNKTRGYKAGEPFMKRSLEAFNPASRQQCARRLMALGWKPSVFDPDTTPTLDEDVLAAIPFPEARVLQRYFTTSKMLAQLSDGKTGWLRVVHPDGRVRGRVNPNGAATGRMSHSKPNMANVDKDPRMRGVWIPRERWKLVGVDAEGLEARMLAHYLDRYDKGAFTQKVVSGKSSERTDVHSANLRSLIDSRLLPEFAWEHQHAFDLARGATGASAKTLLYALMYGAQDPKLGHTLKAIWKDLGKLAERTFPNDPKFPPRELGRMVRGALARAMVGIDRVTAALHDRIDLKQPVSGLDGRRMVFRSKHSALNFLLQGAGAIVMKKSLALFWERHAPMHGVDFGLCANVHDEVQMECRADRADFYGAEFADCIVQAGVALKVRCPQAGKATIGDNWSQTH